MKNKNTKIFLALILLYFFLPLLIHAAGYDFYVDKNSSETREDGSARYPWKTIQAALDHIQSGNLKSKTVLISDGTYAESLEIRNNTDLIGQSESGTVIDAGGFHTAVNFVSTKSKIQRLTIKNANSTNVFINNRSRVSIKNCKIEEAGACGLEVEKSTSAEKYKFSIEDSEISGSGTKGFQIYRRKILISGNEIFSNGEEGIDLHSGQKGTISGNEIQGNKESGIEAILSGARLEIKKNEIEDNHTQGITVQAYSVTKGKVKISENTIKKNHAHGIRFANYTNSFGPKKFRKLMDKYVNLFKNKISENGEEEIYYE
ncbi:MAG TPA: right-handed parallel beta-helix repeat-containing protein [Candidatus Bathyarchaeia archaeon]|nr:right-handed parallel beta-helix repeat-containing protein [Candidatus Bathyarchaeia archaeon]